jgi:transcriptional regulator with XRE-family HTH domain
MTEQLIQTSDWIAVFRARIRELGLTHREVDFRAGWADNYCSKILCGMKNPTAATIERMCPVLKLKLVFLPVDALQCGDSESQLSDVTVNERSNR